MHRPAFMLHDHRKPWPHFDLRLEESGVLHLDYEDEHKSIADIGWWEDVGSNDRRLLLVLHGRRDSVRYALIDTGQDWLLHRTKEQP